MNALRWLTLIVIVVLLTSTGSLLYWHHDCTSEGHTFKQGEWFYSCEGK